MCISESFAFDGGLRKNSIRIVEIGAQTAGKLRDGVLYACFRIESFLQSIWNAIRSSASRLGLIQPLSRNNTLTLENLSSSSAIDKTLEKSNDAFVNTFEEVIVESSLTDSSASNRKDLIPSLQPQEASPVFDEAIRESDLLQGSDGSSLSSLAASSSSNIRDRIASLKPQETVFVSDEDIKDSDTPKFPDDLSLFESFSKEDVKILLWLVSGDFSGMDFSVKYPQGQIWLLLLSLLKNVKKNFDEGTKKKINQFIETFQLASQFQAYLNICTSRSQDAFEMRKMECFFIQKLLSRIAQEGPIYLSSGWANSPSGHHIGLELNPHRRESGSLWISGRIQNRGAGLEYHRSRVAGTKRVYCPEIILEEVPFEELEKSPFLHYYFHLNFLNVPPETMGARAQNSRTAFSEKDYYEVFLSSWPGNVSLESQKRARIEQRGPTCPVKPFFTEISDIFGEKEGRLLKFYLTKSSWELFEKLGGLNQENPEQIGKLLHKFARRARKLEKQCLLPQEEILALDALQKRFKREIQKIREEKTQELKEDKENLDVDFIENPSAQFDIPKMSCKPKGSILFSDEKVLEEDLAGYVDLQLRRALAALDAKSLKKAQMIILHCLRNLPSPLEEAQWNSIEKSSDFLDQLRSMQQILLQTLAVPDGRLIMLPQHACLSVKVLAITYLLTKKRLPPELRRHFIKGFFTLVKERLPPLFIPLMPKDVQDFQDALKVLSEDFGDKDQSEDILSQNIEPEINEGDSFYLKYNKILSLNQALENPELSYLYHLKKSDFSDDDPVKQIGHQFHEITEFGNQYKIPKLENFGVFKFRSPLDYSLLRAAFYYTAFAIDFRGKATSNRVLDIWFAAFNMIGSEKESWVDFSVLFMRIISQDPERYNRGVFADAFEGFHSAGSQKASDRELFVTKLFEPIAKYKEKPLENHNFLHLIQESLAFSGDEKQSDIFSLDPLEIQDLAAIQLSKAFSLSQIEHYFSQNFQRLKEPFFQSLFLAFLFKISPEDFKSPIKRALSAFPENQELSNFFCFLEKGLQQTRNAKSWVVYPFLLRVYAICLSHCLEFSVSQKDLDLNQSLSLEINKRKNFLCYELDFLRSESILEQFRKAEDNELGTSLLSMIPYLSKYESVFQVLERIQAIRLKLSGDRFLQSDREDVHLTEDQKYGSFLLEEEIRLEGKIVQSNLLPDWIVQHDFYQFLFSSKFYPVTETKEGFQFTDEEGTRYRIRVTSKDTIDVFCYFEKIGSWGQFTEQEIASEILPKCFDDGGYFNSNHTAYWIVEELSLLLITDKVYKKIRAQVSNQRIEHPERSDRSLFLDDTCCAFAVLSRISRSSQIVGWKDVDSGALMSIELKDWGFSFEKQVDKEGRIRWSCPKYFGYYLDVHQKQNYFEPYQDYITLTNDQGEKKILFPSYKYSPQKYNFSDSVLFKRGENPLKKLFAYEIDSKGIFILPEEEEALLYLIYLAFGKLDDSLAFEALCKLEKTPSRWTKTMQSLMSYFRSPPRVTDGKLNKTAEGLALMVRLACLQSTQGHQEEIDKNQLVTIYLFYLNQLSNVPGPYRVSLEDEIAMYEMFDQIKLNKTNAEILCNRFDKLKNLLESEKTFNLDVLPDPTRKLVNASQEWDWIDQSMQRNMVQALSRPKRIIFPMRPGKQFLQNLLFYYEIIREKKEPSLIENIRKLLQACKYDTNPRIQCARALLIRVLNAPQSFPPCRELFEAASASDQNATELALGLKRFCATLGPPPEFRSFHDPFDAEPQNLSPLEPRAILEPTAQPERIQFVQAVFDEIPDGLMQLLSEHQIIAFRHPNSTDIEALNQDISSLQEIEKFYEPLAKSPDPSQAAEYRRLLLGTQMMLKELEEKRTQLASNSQPHLIEFQDEKIDLTIKEVAQSIESARKILHEKQEEIEELLDAYPEELVLEAAGALLASLSFKEALIAFGRAEDEPFYRANPCIANQDLARIKQKIGDYLLLTLDTQKKERFLKKMEKARKIAHKKGMGSIEYAHEKNAALEIARGQRTYKPQDCPHLMVFEAFADICLREDQKEALDAIVSDGRYDMILEARTGFGKSKALIPLWLYLTGKSRKKEDISGLSMMTVPKALYQQQLTYLKKVLGEAFNQSVFGFEFDRAKGNDVEYLRYLNKQLDRAAAQGMCVLTTIQSLHGLVVLKVKESLLMGGAEGKDLLQQLHPLRQKVRHHLSNFFDESRECFDIRRHFDYAVKAPAVIAPEYSKILETIYTIILQMKDRPLFDFLPHSSEAGFLFTEDLYMEKFKPVLAKQLLDHLIKNRILPDPGEDLSEDLFKHFMGSSSPSVSSYLDRLNQRQEKVYAIYRDQLNIYLLRTLTRKCNGRYGLVPSMGSRLAFPFEREVPSLSSQFSTTDDLLDFTVQANLKTPFTTKEIGSFIFSLQSRLMKEGAISDKDKSYKCYLQITQKLGSNWPNDIFSCQKQEIEKLKNFLNHPENLPSKLTFICSEIIPKIFLHKYKITSSPHNLAGLIEKKFGASGTVNTDTLPKGLTTIERLTTPISTILSLWKHSQDSIYVIKTKEARKDLQRLLQKYQNYQVIIDVNSMFRDLRDEREIAQIIFEATAQRQPRIHAVSYYNEAGENRVFIRPKAAEPLAEAVLREHCTHPLEEIFVFMRQSSVVGADTPMTTTANALVSVGSDTERDLFLQGIGRMRGILQGQKVGFVIEEKDAPAFAGQGASILLRDILSLVSRNQGKQRGKDLFFNLQILLQNLVEQQFWNSFDQALIDFDSTIEIFQAMEKFFVKCSDKDFKISLMQTRGLIPIKEAVEQMKNGFFAFLAPLLQNPEISEAIDLKKAKEDFENLIDWEKLPNEIEVGSCEEYEAEVEAAELEEELIAEAAELEAEEENEAELENERENVAMSNLPFIPFTPAIPVRPTFYSKIPFIDSMKIQNEFSDDYQPILASIYAADNYFRINSEFKRPAGILKTSYQYLLVRTSQGEYKVVLMDRADAWAAKQDLLAGKPMNDADFYLMSSLGKVIVQNAKKDFDEVEWMSHPELTLMTKVFSRQLNFSQKEIDHFTSLSLERRQLYFKFFEKEIISCWPSFESVFADMRGE